MRTTILLATALLLNALLLNAAVYAAPGAASTADLDEVAKKIIARERVVGASVRVARGSQIILQKGYGFSDLDLEVPAKDETVYHVVGPMLPFTGIAVMQQVERGKLSLDDDISKCI